MKLNNKIALITGGSGGIGRAIALKFAKEGAKVVVNYNKSEDKAIEIVREIEKVGSEAIAIKCDVSKEGEVKEMIEKAVKKFGKIDILVNNAGIVYDVPLFKKTIDQWNETFGVNLNGIFLCSKYAYKHMEEGSSIINISSTNGIHTLSPESADYDASKSAVISLTKNLAEELAPKIRVNSVAPGWVDTEMNKDLPKDFIEGEKKKTLLRRFGTPDEIANVVLFLASDEARFITRNVVVVDGGYK